MLISTKQQLDALLPLKQPIALDLETTGLDPQKDRILGIAIADANLNTYFILPELIPHLHFLKSYTKILHNFKFDYRFLAKAGIDLFGTPTDDTLVLHHLKNENLPHDLSSVITDVLGELNSYKDEFWAKYDNAQEAPIEELAEYAMRDVKYTSMVYSRLVTITYLPIYEHTMRLAHALGATERDGVCVDIPYVINLGVTLQKRIQGNLLEMTKMVSGEIGLWEMGVWLKEIEKRKTDKGKAGVKKPVFSFDSGKQLGELLYDIMGLPEQKNKEQRRTVDDAALASIESKHKVIELIRDQREANKIYGTYIQGVLERTVNDRVYPTFNVCGTVTGRISHQNPNMGNMPRSGEIRGMFVPSEGRCLISADYGQLEICLAAHFSGDQILIDTINEGKSMHDITANALGCDRQLAKTLNFAILYGASKYKIAHVFGCNHWQAQEIIDKFFKTYPGLKSTIDECHRKVENNELLTNPFGRTRSFIGNWSNQRELEGCKRQAFNFLIQSTGADITNKSFYEYARHLSNTGIGRALFTVHDEIIAEVKEAYYPVEKFNLSTQMIQVGVDIKLKVPLSVDVSEPLKRWEK